jgi:uncharacterized repeat protein (TIGR01451 family)
MGGRLSFVIGTMLSVVGLALVTPTIAGRPEEPEAQIAAKPASEELARPLDPPDARDNARAKPKAGPRSVDTKQVSPRSIPPEELPSELPSDFGTPARSPSNLGPDPPSYGAPTRSPAIGPAKPTNASDRLAGPVPAKNDTLEFNQGTSLEPEVEALFPDSLPMPSPMAPPPRMPEPAPFAFPLPAAASGKLDASVERAQAKAKGKKAAPELTAVPQVAIEDGSLPPATVRPGQSGTPSPPSTARESDPAFVLPSDRLPIGRQCVGLTVEVVSPQVLNINQTGTLKVVVKNNGQTDALGVVVRDELPPSLTFLSSQPEAQRIEALLSWSLGTIPAGSERLIRLTVKPTKVGSFDHAATVTMMAGGRSQTLVREPKLKVEQTVTSGKILLRKPAQFTISVSNPGDGPARNVVIQAKLSPGLKHESGEPNEQNLFEQTIDLINPGQRVELDTLVADTTVGGEQSCEVVAKSPDVVYDPADAHSLKTISVVEPKLGMTVAGPDKRYTDTVAKYEITLENPGTAPARNVRIQATVPVSGRLLAPLPAGARWDPQTKKISWTRPQLDPGEKAVLAFEVRMGGVGLYQVAAEARADGPLLAKDTISTDVTGLADVDLEVTENRRVVDVGDATVFKIKIVNKGTKEATGIRVSAKLSDNIEPTEISGTDQDGNFDRRPEQRLAVFPQIPRLGAGKQIELAIRVKATKDGPAVCRVMLDYDDQTEKLDDLAVFKVQPTRR